MKEFIKNLSKQQKICLSLWAVYSVLTLIGALCHENWADDAQAWVIVRDNNLAGIFNALQYEGHPPLWYMILFPFVKLGFPLVTLSLISWTISVITAYLVMMKSPFNTGMKATIIFSSGFLFYNSIGSRIYCVIVLLTCILAILYKDRKKHPIVFGLLVGLLAQTHVIMCGLVGILGIYMIIDFFKDFKINTAKKNWLNILGLGLAGIGVVVLVLFLMLSMSKNNYVVSHSVSADNFMERILNIFTCIGKNLFIMGNRNAVVGNIVGYIVSFLIVAALFLMKKYPKALIASLIFSAFFFLATQIIYSIMLPVRADVYIYTLICIFWVIKNSATSKRSIINIDKTKSKIVQRTKHIMGIIDNKANYYITLLLCLVCVISIPRGVFWLVFDYFGEYTCAPAAVEFIKNELPEDSIIVINDSWVSQYCACDPELKIYSLKFKDFITYCRYDITYGEMKKNRNSIHEELKNYKHIYIIYHSGIRYTYNYWDLYNLTKIYEDTTLSDDYIMIGSVDIYELTPEQVEEMFLTPREDEEETE